VFSASNAKCLFCEESFSNLTPPAPLFDIPYLFLNEKIGEIDGLISSGKRDGVTLRTLSRLFDEVLEWQPQISSVFWRRFLVSVGCKTDQEVINKGVLIEGNAAYEAAFRHGNEDEKEAYGLLVKVRARIIRLLEAELIKSEKSKKIGTDAEKKLADFKNQLANEERQVLEDIKKLKGIERTIREQEMDCSSIAGEYKHALDKTLQEAKHIWRSPQNEISYEDKTNWESQLDALQRVSNAEFEKLKQLESSHHAFADYSRLVDEQKAVCAEINSRKGNLDRLKTSIEQIVSTIKDITDEYNSVREAICAGDFSKAERVLSNTRFEALVKQALREVK